MPATRRSQGEEARFSARLDSDRYDCRVVDCCGLVLVRSALAGSPARSDQSLAVLPLENLSRDPAQDYFADGMTETLIAGLAKVGALRVSSRTSLMPYKETRLGLSDIARELNVDAVMEGSVQRFGERVKITARLIHARTERNLWNGDYERNLGDVRRFKRDRADYCRRFRSR
jgi:TolB-like protein